MTPNSKLVLDYLKQNYGQEFTKQEIASTLGIPMPAVVGSTNAMKKKKHISEREETIVDEKQKEKVIKYVTLTTAGLDYDPEAEEEAARAEKAAKAAAKKAQKEAAEAADAT